MQIVGLIYKIYKKSKKIWRHKCTSAFHVNKHRLSSNTILNDALLVIGRESVLRERILIHDFDKFLSSNYYFKVLTMHCISHQGLLMPKFKRNFG